MKKIEIDKDLLYRIYIEENHNIQDTANLMNVSYRSIQRAIKENNFNKSQIQIQQQRKNLLKERYGVENTYQLDKSKEKSKETKLNRYGSETYNNSKQQKQTMKEKYGVSCGYNLPEVQERIKSRYGGLGTSSIMIKDKVKDTVQLKYGVPYFCLKEECYSKNGFTNSKVNQKFAKKLKNNNISFEQEYRIVNKSFDFKVNNILIELNPTYTHNSTKSIIFKKFNKNPLSIDYHLDKTKLALDNNFRCIHIWDWDDANKIIEILKSKVNIQARKCKIKEVSIEDMSDFINKYHLQGNCKGQSVRLGLYYNNELIQIMTFGKPRYNKNYEYELLRLCTKFGYSVVGGSNKLFKYFIEQYNPKSIISYCDNSKFNGEVYLKLGFNLKSFGSPSRHWYNLKTKQHITDNLLRQRGFDQLFNTNYGKGTSNNELMIKNGFVEIYDAGQSTYIWNKEEA